MKKLRKTVSFYVMLALCAFALLLGTLQLILTRWSSRTVSDEIYSAAHANVTYLRDHMEDTVQALTLQLDYLLSYDDVNRYFVYGDTASPVESFAQLSAVKDVLDLSRSSNSFIDEIRLYYVTRGVCVTSSAKSANVTRLDQSQRDMLYERIRRTSTQRSALVEMDGEYLVLGRKPSGTGSAGRIPVYYIETVLRKDELTQYLTSFSAYRNRYSLLFNHATDALLFGTALPLSDADRAALCACFATDGAEIRTSRVRLDGTDYAVFSGYSTLLHSTFAQMVPTSDLDLIPRRIFTGMVLIIVVAFLGIGAIALVYRRHIQDPIRDLIDAFAQTSKGRFDTRLSGARYPAEFHELSERFNQMNQKIESLIETNYEQKLRIQRAEFKQLQAQINPHFLYNSFFLLRHMVQYGDYDACRQCLNHLGRYFQFIADGSRDVVLLSDEYAHAMHYFEIQLLRFEDALSSDIEPMPSEYARVPVPKLILQPIFENVLTHGAWKNSGVRRVRLRFIEMERNGRSYLQITVEDNGADLSDADIAAVAASLAASNTAEGTSGLVNIHRRLQCYYGDETCGVRVARSELGGFLAALVLSVNDAETKEANGNG